MEKRVWLIAVAIVAVAIAFLAWDPDSPTLTETAPPAANAPIATLDEAAPPPITTVTLAASASNDVDPAAALRGRFESETTDAVWAARASSRIHALFAELPATATAVECRRTACRVTAAMDDGTDPTAGVAAILEGLTSRGVLALLQRAEDGQLDLLVAP